MQLSRGSRGKPSGLAATKGTSHDGHLYSLPEGAAHLPRHRGFPPLPCLLGRVAAGSPSSVRPLPRLATRSTLRGELEGRACGPRPSSPPRPDDSRRTRPAAGGRFSESARRLAPSPPNHSDSRRPSERPRQERQHSCRSARGLTTVRESPSPRSEISLCGPARSADSPRVCDGGVAGASVRGPTTDSRRATPNPALPIAVRPLGVVLVLALVRGCTSVPAGTLPSIVCGGS